jgi:hypothetical protein
VWVELLERATLFSNNKSPRFQAALSTNVVRQEEGKTEVYELCNHTGRGSDRLELGFFSGRDFFGTK